MIMHKKCLVYCSHAVQGGSTRHSLYLRPFVNDRKEEASYVEINGSQKSSCLVLLKLKKSYISSPDASIILFWASTSPHVGPVVLDRNP